MSNTPSNQNQNSLQETVSEKLHFALDAAEIGIWDLNLLQNKEVIWDNRCRQLFGLNSTSKMSYEQAISYIHADDREAVDAAVQRAMNPKYGGSYDVRYRTIGADDGVLRFVRFIGGASFNADGVAIRMTGIAMDVSYEMTAINAKLTQTATEDKFKNVTNTSPTGLWLSDTDGNLTYLNKTLTDWTGMPYDALLGFGWANAVVEEDRAAAATAFMDAIHNKVHYEADFRINKSNGEVVWCKASGDPFYDENGNYGGYAGFCMDIDERVKMISSLAESEGKIRSIVEQAPVAIGVLRGENFTVESANHQLLKIWGKDAGIIGKSVTDALPELEGQPFVGYLQDVLKSGKLHNGDEALAKIEYDGIIKEIYVDFVFEPLKNQVGETDGILIVATDVTKQVVARLQLQDSEMRFRAIVEEAPFATCVFRSPELYIDIANQSMLSVWGRDDKVLGMKLQEAIPELQGQPFIELLKGIFTSGEPWSATDAKAELVIDGVLETKYFNYNYKPLFNSEGKVYAVLNMAIDVTQQFIDKKKIEEAEIKLRIAIETANLGTWEILPKSNEIIVSQRIKYWLGIENVVELTLSNFFKLIPGIEVLENAVQDALQSHENGTFDVEYVIWNDKTNQNHILHTVGQTFYDEDGQPYLLTGSTKDITIQRNTEMELENQVQIRTEELQATNEELETTNEELGETNENLHRSNGELEQYAYVASHDLQEPLRKIRVFSDILSQQESLGDSNRPMVKKISQAAERMTLLIKDLLDFSRLLKADRMMKTVPLSGIIKEVVNDFELLIDEKYATVKIESELPDIESVSLQMNQLFYNILNNALKFTDPDRKPEISIRCTKLSREEIKKIIPRHQRTTYYDITVSDNGIGFDQKFSEQIFEVFKRLHGRNEFAGSGIGLALCRRIVLNHNGFITVESEIGKGSAFHIILPAKQL